MLIATKLLGEVEIKKEDIISFENGILGFEDEKKFALLPLGEESPFVLLQSIVNDGLGFIMSYPFAFFPDYQFSLSQEEREEMKLTSGEDALAYTIVTVQNPFKESTMNLLAPIVINNKEHTGKQIVLREENYTTKHSFPK